MVTIICSLKADLHQIEILTRFPVGINRLQCSHNDDALIHFMSLHVGNCIWEWVSPSINKEKHKMKAKQSQTDQSAVKLIAITFNPVKAQMHVTFVHIKQFIAWMWRRCHIYRHNTMNDTAQLVTAIHFLQKMYKQLSVRPSAPRSFLVWESVLCA